MISSLDIADLKRPFLMYWGPGVLFFELSTPFLNIHWFSVCFVIGGLLMCTG
jgi:hypothetical protein